MENKKVAVLKGARKRKSKSVRRLLLNKVPIDTRAKTGKQQKPRRECHSIENETVSENESAVQLLQEPQAKITLIERAFGEFNAFNDRESLNNPLNTSVSVGPPFTCNICQSWFYVGAKLKLHYVVNHELEHCELCGILFHTKDEKQKHVSDKHNPFLCEICKQEICVNKQFQHYDSEHNGIACKYCRTIIKPKSNINEHYRNKHHIQDSYINVLNDFEVKGSCFVTGDFEVRNKAIIVNSETDEFVCRLCSKTRKTDVFFGHMNSFHKINCTSFVNLVKNENITLAINGTLMAERVVGDKEEILPIRNQINKNTTCYICCEKNTDEIPNRIHYVYCQSKVQCLHCDLVYDNEKCRDMHMKRSHSKFSCSMEGCDNKLVTYNSEDDLESHVLKSHRRLNCRYCDLVTPIDKLKPHLLETHCYTATVMKNFKDTLFEISESDGQPLVICCLCDENITSLIDSVKNIYEHYSIFHKVCLKKILRLMTSKPVLSEYENFYKEIDNSIESNRSNHEISSLEEGCEHKLTDEEDVEVNICNKENIELSNSDTDMKIIKADEDVEEKPYESDFDPVDVEGLIDSENDEKFETHKCEICQTEFITMLDFVTHLKNKHDLSSKYKEIECKICLNVFVNDYTFTKHIINSHDISDGIDETYHCNTCGVNLYKRAARDHIIQKHYEDLNKYDVNDFGFKCRFCSESYWERLTLNDHETINHFSENNDSFHRCFNCLYVFSSHNCLKNHAVKEHEVASNYGDLSYKCLKCMIVYPNINSLRDHFKNVHPKSKLYRCMYPNCYRTYKLLKSLQWHVKTPHSDRSKELYEPKPCEFCGKIMKSARGDSIHKAMKHRRESGFQCRLCKEIFRNSEQRKLHLATSHPGEQAYICLECGKGFASKSGLYGHKKSHQKGPAITCPYCNKEFMRRDSYSEHLLIHVGPRHQCPHCPKSFTQRSNLMRHVRIHTGSKPYACIYCDKRFSDQGAKRSHERVHTKEEHCKCSECGKKFTKWQKLKYHMKFHTGKGLVTCDVCEKQFSNTYTLNEHRRIHNQQTLVMCECGKGFSTVKYLLRHKTLIHGQAEPKFSCPICFKNFYNKTPFNDHIMTHSGTKYVRCLLCDKSYNTRRTVRKHLIEKHNLQPSDDLKRYIHKMTPEEVGLVIPSASDMSINITELLDRADTLNVDISMLETFNKTGAKSQPVEIKTEPLSTNDEHTSEEEMTVNKKKLKSRKIKKPKKYERNGTTSKRK